MDRRFHEKASRSPAKPLENAIVMAITDKLQKISETVWELPSSHKEDMRVPARIIATEKLVREMDEAVYQQISNVATLPGITRYALHAGRA
jgi:tRNA-splicing ligase RtcB